MNELNFRFPKPETSDEIRQLRRDVRAFIQAELDAGSFVPKADCWCAGYSPEFSQRLGERGWLGMTWPSAYGGGERSALERYVVTEELLAAGAPVMAHWIADRQSGALVLAHGNEEMKQDILPRIAQGKCYFAIGLSEPDSGSDLASVRTRATKVDGGWRINGTKLWSSGAQHCHYMIVLARSRPLDEKHRHAGMSQFLVNLDAQGVEIRGIADMTGDKHFNETHFDDVFVSDDCLLGNEGDGWRQVTGELALERSGPERFLSTTVVLEHVFRTLKDNLQDREAETIGRLTARLRSLRAMSLGVATLLNEGESPEVEAAMVKELGTRFEGDVVYALRELMPLLPLHEESSVAAGLLAESFLRLPSYTIRGGTNQILKGIVARGIGIR